MEKKRVIVDYSTLPNDVLEIMASKYPDGYDHDVIKFPNAKGELISAVRIENETTIYLVKISKQLQQMVDDFEGDDDDMEDEDISTTIAKNIIPKGVIPDDELDEEDDEEEEYKGDSNEEDDEDY